MTTTQLQDLTIDQDNEEIVASSMSLFIIGC